jgi:hypothetical protein
MGERRWVVIESSLNRPFALCPASFETALRKQHNAQGRYHRVCEELMSTSWPL